MKIGVIKPICILCVIITIAWHTVAARADDGALRICGVRESTASLIKAIISSYEADTSRNIKVIEGVWRQKVEKLASGDVDIIVVRDDLTDKEKLIIEWKRDNCSAAVSRYVMGYANLLVVVGTTSNLHDASAEQLVELVSANSGRSSSRNKGIREVFIENDPLVQMLVNERLLGKLDDRGELNSSVPMGENAKTVPYQELIKRVSANPQAIGLVLDRGQDLPNLRVVHAREENRTRNATIGPVAERDAFISEAVTLVILDSVTSSDAKEFCKYACGLKGATITEKYGLLTQRMQREVEGKARLVDMKAGKGVHLSTVGIGDGNKAVSDLAIEYVKTKATIRLGYSATDSDTVAVGMFVRIGADATTLPTKSASPEDTSDSSGSTTMLASEPAVTSRITPFVKAGGSELLFLPDKPSTRAMELHGEKWNALGMDKDGKPDGTGPAEYTLAGRAVAVIVNPANKLETLTLGQIQAIFQGDVDDWAILGGTELLAPAAADGKPGKLDIHRFGLRPGDTDERSAAAARVFYREGVPADRLRRVTLQNNTAEAVAAVSLDPQAIAFVDLTAIPAVGQSVKVLPIKMGTGGKAKIIQPTPENLKNAMYPLSQRLFLYVHPKASDTAKDFAKFIATCGGSEASPYADTVKAVMEAYQKHGLIPLADAALQRAAKDALAEAAAKAKAAEAAKGKRQ